MMLHGKIEKNVPMPLRGRAHSTFHEELIGFLGKLEIGDSVLFQFEQFEPYKFDVKAKLTFKIYGIITGKEFISRYDHEAHKEVRIWRLK